MPRKGYVIVTLEEDARDKLNELKKLMGVKSISEVVNRLYEAYLLWREVSLRLNGSKAKKRGR